MRIHPEKRNLLRSSMNVGATNGNESEAFVDDSNECDDDDDDDDWGVVSTEDLPHEIHDRSNQLYQTGVLIISGSDDGVDDEQPYVGRVPIAEVYPTATDLSLPGTLSIPTDPGTLDDEEANEILRRAKERRSSPSNSDVRRKPGFPDRPNRATKPLLIVAVVILSGLIGCIIFLFNERHYWRSSALGLEQEIRHLKDLQEKMAQRNKIKPLPAPQQRFGWEDSCHQPVSAEELTLLDNCWLHAKAKVKFGECAAEAQQAIKGWSVSFVETADAFGKAVWNAAATWKDVSNSTNSTEQGNGHSSFSNPRVTSMVLKGYFDTVTLQVRKAAKNIKALGPLLDQTASAALKGLDEAARAAVAAGATAGEAVVVASELATEMVEDFVEVAREVMEDATRTARLARIR